MYPFYVITVFKNHFFSKKLSMSKFQFLCSHMFFYYNRDKQMESHVHSKLQEAQKILKKLQDRETLIQTKVSQTKNKNKLTIF